MESDLQDVLDGASRDLRAYMEGLADGLRGSGVRPESEGFVAFGDEGEKTERLQYLAGYADGCDVVTGELMGKKKGGAA